MKKMNYIQPRVVVEKMIGDSHVLTVSTALNSPSNPFHAPKHSENDPF